MIGKIADSSHETNAAGKKEKLLIKSLYEKTKQLFMGIYIKPPMDSFMLNLGDGLEAMAHGDFSKNSIKISDSNRNSEGTLINREIFIKTGDRALKINTVISTLEKNQTAVFSEPMQIWKITDKAQNDYYEDIGNFAMMSNDRSNIIKVLREIEQAILSCATTVPPEKSIKDRYTSEPHF